MITKEVVIIFLLVSITSCIHFRKELISGSLHMCFSLIISGSKELFNQGNYTPENAMIRARKDYRTVLYLNESIFVFGGMLSLKEWNGKGFINIFNNLNILKEKF